MTLSRSFPVGRQWGSGRLCSAADLHFATRKNSRRECHLTAPAQRRSSPAPLLQLSRPAPTSSPELAPSQVIPAQNWSCTPAPGHGPYLAQGTDDTHKPCLCYPVCLGLGRVSPCRYLCKYVSELSQICVIKVYPHTCMWSFCVYPSLPV